MNCYDLYLELKKKYKDVSEVLFLHKGTLKRWEEKKEVPSDYELNLKLLLGKKINTNDFTYQQKNQFFTSKENAEFIVKKVKETIPNINDYIFLEPSAGDGVFIDALKNNGITNVEALDIEPRRADIKQQNFLEYTPIANKKYILIGNPPFGLRGNTALLFFKKALNFCDYVCFILPQLFNSDGKGSPNTRITEFTPILTENIDSNFRYPDNTSVKVNSIFQIWKKQPRVIDKCKTIKGCKVVSISNGKTSSSKRNISYIGKCDAYIPSTCFGEEKLKIYYDFYQLPNQRGYGFVFEDKTLLEKLKNIKEYYFKSTNGAYNIRLSEIKKVLS